ncbi:thyroid transcription factor 1-associated protein 26 homolog [Lampris incognitus]|uniref:thyroid transcription factor 1-associated protein 26 homolog n=1 Tax=Lampris incognitus TaxID=2546036 RepID=UPI0024B5C7C0|nr:thyroid transcription factor 1-associated protein 26 homolog [Lampris incognitus]
MKNAGKVTEKSDAWKASNNKRVGVNKKRKWIPEHKVFDGSVKEGQGFAYKRKQKVQYEYNKLLRKERKKMPQSNTLYKEDYPEHLKHLYLAEAEKLKNETRMNKQKRNKCRMEAKSKFVSASDGTTDQSSAPSVAAVTEQSDTVKPELTVPEVTENLPMSNRMKKKLMRKTSYQKTREEFEKVKENRRRKKEEYQKNKQQREEAIQKYKQKKKETFQILSKKTKKGQPNLNLRMECLLQKIQGAGK